MTKLLHILLFIQNLDASKEKIISLKIPVQIVWKTRLNFVAVESWVFA